MPLLCSNLLAVSQLWLPRIRLASMFLILIVSLSAGFLAVNRFALAHHWAKRIMTVVLVFFDAPITLFVIWPMKLTAELIWLPITGLVLLLVLTALAAVFFSRSRFDPKTRLTLILGAALSNNGYTGAAFVCYALFGLAGLAMANLYLVFYVPLFYLVYLPFLKFRELRSQNGSAHLDLAFILDPRCLVIPAVIVAAILNLNRVSPPAFLTSLPIVDMLVYIASALAFFAIGMQVSFSRLKSHVSFYPALFAIKFLLTPALAFIIISLLAFSGHPLTDPLRRSIMVLSAAPCAVLMVTMSSVFDLNGSLAGALWVVTMAVFVAVVVPVMFLVFA